MSRNIFALLLGCLMIALTAFFSAPAHSQSRTLAKVVIRVILNDNEKTARLVQHFDLVVKKLDELASCFTTESYDSRNQSS
jgi:hypothetical protein